MSESTKVKYLIVGGGAAGAQAAVGIREVDKEGSVTIACAEKWWPYDRPPLSKSLLHGRTTPEDAESKDPSWYTDNRVQVLRGNKASSIDRSAKRVTFEDGSQLEYEKLVIATGSLPIPLDVPGAGLKGVHLLRRVDDSLAIRNALATAKAPVLIGAGYIGLEVGAACIDKGLFPTIVDSADLPWSRTSGPDTGKFIKEYFESKGATFYLGSEVSGIEGETSVTGVLLKGGGTVPADLVVIGVGIAQNLEFAMAAGLEIDSKSGVMVDAHLKTSDPDIFAAGDIASFVDPVTGRRWHAEHHLNARWQGKQAGRNAAGAGEKFDQVSYFFSDMLDIHMILRGDPLAGKPAATLGDVSGGEYLELHAFEDGSLTAGLAISHEEPSLDKISDKLEELIRARAKVADLSLQTFGLA